MNKSIAFRGVLFAAVVLWFTGISLFAQGQPGLYDGHWAGTTGEGKSFSFVIGNNGLLSLHYVIFIEACGTFETSITQIDRQLTGNMFTLLLSAKMFGSDSVTGSISPTHQATGTLAVTRDSPPFKCNGAAQTTWTASLAPGQLTVTGLSPSSAAAGEMDVTLSVTGTGFSPVSTVQWNGSALATSYFSGTQLKASVPASLIATPGTVRVTVTNPDGTVSNAALFAIGPPVIGTVVNGASFQPGISPNSFVTIKGTNLAAAYDTWDRAIVSGKLPTSLDGVSVSIGGKPAYIQYISPEQLNVLAPDVGFGLQPVTVTNSAGTSAVANVTAQQFGPAFFLWTGKYVVATHQDFSYAAKRGLFGSSSPTIPAKPGEVIVLWGTGFGPTDPAIAAGVLAPADKIYSTANPVMVTVGTAAAQVYGSVLAPGFAGLYQIAIQVPSSTPDGDIPIKAYIGGFESQDNVFLTVQH